MGSAVAKRTPLLSERKSAPHWAVEGAFPWAASVLAVVVMAAGFAVHFGLLILALAAAVRDLLPEVLALRLRLLVLAIFKRFLLLFVAHDTFAPFRP